MLLQDTVAAISTAPGAGAIGIVRLTGANSIFIASRLFVPANGNSLFDTPSRKAIFGRIREGEREIDEALLLLFRAPSSYTGEDCVEIHCHGGVYLLQEVLDLCTRLGARPAQPGEFTRRAFLAGKLELSQAEAVADLIAAAGEGALRAALSAKDGALSTEIAKLVESLSGISARLAFWSDDPDDDFEPLEPDDLSECLKTIYGHIDALLQTYGRGRLLKEGIATAIVGKPNVGKSTLMNLLSGHRRSIVTDIPGTTRDIVQETVRMGDFVLRLLDTAGIRSTDDPVEREGVELAKDQIASAQLVLAVFDGAFPLDDQDFALLDLLSGAPCIAVVNKTDLPQRLDTDFISSKIDRMVYLSAQSGEGKTALELEISALLGLDTFDASSAIVANQRQRHCLLCCAEHLQEAITAVCSGFTLDAANVCIDEALDALLELTGERATDKVIDEVFARFCVGK